MAEIELKACEDLEANEKKAERLAILLE